MVMTLPIGHNHIPYGTPLHVTQLALALLKAAFAEMGGEDYAYRYQNDFDATGIVIDTVFNKDSGVYGKKPQLVVARGGISPQQVSLGDRADKSVKTTNEVQTSLIQSSLEIRVLSKSSLEVDILGNEVFNFLLMCRGLFPKMLGVHIANHPNLSAVSQTEQDDTLYVCTASLQYSMQYKWLVLPPQELLKGIDFYINDIFTFELNHPESNEHE